jgi:hypothetical protein
MSGDMDSSNKIITFNYKFRFENGPEKEFNVELDEKTLNLIHTKKESYPEWTALNYLKCPNCPLREDQHERCPVAASLVDLVDFFRTAISYEDVVVLIETEARGYIKHAPLPQGINSLIGIYMVTAGCPIMEKLKPMVRYHLPFATLRETQYRVISMYLLAQYFLYKRGKEPDWDLTDLVKIYDDIRIVNKKFFLRLADLDIEDATLNALVKLDLFAQHVSISVDRDVLDEIENLFSAYFE